MSASVVREVSSVRVTLSAEDSMGLGKMLAANDSPLFHKTTLKSMEGYEVFVELDWTWLQELQTGSAFVWISVPGARFTAAVPRRLGRDLAAVLLGESDILIPVWMGCDADADHEVPGETPVERFPVYFVPTKTDLAAVPPSKKVPVKSTPVRRRTVPSRSARQGKARSE